MLKLLAARALLRLLSVLPQRFLHGAGWMIGRLLAFFPWRRKNIIAANLAIAFPDRSEDERRALLTRNLVESARLVLESGMVWHASRRRLLGRIRQVEGWVHAERAVAAGRGLIVVGAHLGNWELVSLFGSTRLPIAYLYKPPKDPRLDAALTESRKRFGADLIATGSPAMRRMLGQLRAGGVVGLLCDQLPRRGEGVHAPLFGRPALTMTLVGRLARRTGAAVVFGHCLRLPAGRGWKVVLEPAGEAIVDPDPEVAAAELNRMVERGIRLAPDQYLWSYKRWALPPEGQVDPYESGD